MLEADLRKRLEDRDLLLMTHLVIGYPSLEASFELLESMVNAGVDLIELQIPFSEPIADGPVILKANQDALRAGVRVAQCLDFAEAAAKRFDIPIVLMTYYNIPFKFGVERFVSRMAAAGLRGAIVPDLPFEEAGDYLAAMSKHRLDPIFIVSPTTTDERLRQIGQHARGFVYCVSRTGVTGAETEFAASLGRSLERWRSATKLPLAVGFGVKERANLDYLRGKAEIAVIGSQTIRILEERGVAAAADFIAGLRPPGARSSA